MFATVKAILLVVKNRMFQGPEPLTKDQLEHIDYVMAIYSQLTTTELNAISNGFGSALPGLRLATYAIPEYYRRALKPAADFHDLGYEIGGDEDHREAIDTHFLWLETSIAKDLPIARMIPGLAASIAAWKAVDIGGAMSFEYRTMPLTPEEVREVVKAKMVGDVWLRS